MKKLFTLGLILLSLFFGSSPAVYSADEGPQYLELRNIDAGTFNEFRYLIGQKYLELKRDFLINNTLDKATMGEIEVLAKTAKNYLPDNLTNDNLYNNLSISVQKGVKQPANRNNFTAITQAIQAYLEQADIQSLSGDVTVTPSEGNAPLPVSLRAQVVDPSGSQLYDYNYTWWIDDAGERKIIGSSPSIIYTFTKQGTFGVFLDVESNHKNADGYTDVLPLRKKISVKVNEKIASVILHVNNNKTVSNSLIKISPEEAKYGVVFDATSSTPSDGSQFQRTKWNFGNGVIREYNGGPKIERVKFDDKGEYEATLEFITNEGNTITRVFDIVITQPIANIKASATSGFLGDSFNFHAKNSDKFEGLNYSWEIVDISREKVIYKRSGTALKYNFPNKGKYNVKLAVGDGSNADYDTKTIYINSRPPVAEFIATKPDLHKPNRVLLDGTRSYDPDYVDEGKLEYGWFIDGEKVTLEDSNESGSRGYYSFDSLGKHSVVLVVVDSDNISHQKQAKVEIQSLLSVDFDMNPKVIQRNSSISFTADAPRAESFEWDFGDGTKQNTNSPAITHTYKKSGVNNVKLTAIGKDNKKTRYTREVYVGDADTPYALIGVSLKNNSSIGYVPNKCFGNDAYIANKVDAIQFSADNSIDINGSTSGLEYSWKLGQDNLFSQKNFSYKFDEVGCFPVKLTVKSKQNSKIHSQEVWIRVENLAPTINSLNLQVLDESTDPVIVNVSARGAQDRDGVIQSYLWYYYTDADSEPQDFKSTTTPDTTFVLPKVTGNYYFVVVLKDSNEQRTNSEEATGEKFYITLSGDNVNTPLIDLGVSDSAVEIGETVVYTATVENILGRDISGDGEYSWDFDGDGFYEKQTKKPTVSHSFTSSGEFHSKLKVKNKGFSNVKTVTINVANRLIPDFDTIAIGDKQIFVNKSSGEIDKLEWDLGDGNKQTATSTFTHLYTDNKKKHDVTLKIYEGTQVKEITKTVAWHPKNLLKSKKKDLNVFTYPEAETGTLKLVNPSENVYVYLAESEDTYEYFSIDYDTSYDSDLNGGLDDDEDNKANSSYNSGAPAKIILNDSRVQNVKIYGRDVDNNVLGVYDLEITKLYILESDNQSGTLSDIEFSGVSDAEKVKIEKLKNHLIQLPQEQRLKAMKYLEKLQEEWFDNTEKTRVIVEFQQYMESTGYNDSSTVNDLLQSFLVQGQEDQSEEAINYNALTSLIPENIVCETPENMTCKQYLISKIDAIPQATDIETKTALGKEVYDVIKLDPAMTAQQKTDFHAILKTYTYRGVENVPEEQKRDVEVIQDKQSGGFIQFITKLAKIIGLFLAVLALAILGFWIFYKLKNSDKNIGFQDYIIDSTRHNDNTEKQKEDVLSDIVSETLETKAPEPEVEKQSQDVLPEIMPNSSEKPVRVTEKKAIDERATAELAHSDGAVPDWLQGANSKVDALDQVVQEPKKQKQEKPPQAKKVGTPHIKEEASKKIVSVDVPVEPKKETKNTKPELDKLTNIDENKSNDEAIPDWLKGAVEETPAQIEDKKSSADQKSKAPLKSENKKPSDSDLPDWLKGSMDEAPAKETSVKKESTTNGRQENKKPRSEKKNPETKAESETSAKKKQSSKKSKDIKVTKVETKATDTTSTTDKKDDTKTQVKKDDLWDDGMDVPDWLKGIDSK